MPSRCCSWLWCCWQGNHSTRCVLWHHVTQFLLQLLLHQHHALLLLLLALLLLLLLCIVYPLLPLLLLILCMLHLLLWVSRQWLLLCLCTSWLLLLLVLLVLVLQFSRSLLHLKVLQQLRGAAGCPQVLLELCQVAAGNSPCKKLLDAQHLLLHHVIATQLQHMCEQDGTM